MSSPIPEPVSGSVKFSTSCAMMIHPSSCNVSCPMRKSAPSGLRNFVTGIALLEQCTHLAAVSRPDDPNAVKNALSRMIDYSDFVIAVYDPASHRGDAVDQAMDDLRKTEKPYLMIHPDTLELQLCQVNH